MCLAIGTHSLVMLRVVVGPVMRSPTHHIRWVCTAISFQRIHRTIHSSDRSKSSMLTVHIPPASIGTCCAPQQQQTKSQSFSLFVLLFHENRRSGHGTAFYVGMVLLLILGFSFALRCDVSR